MARHFLAVDGGNSKADVAIVDDTGRLLAAVRGPSISHQAVGLDAGMATLTALVEHARNQAGLGAASIEAAVLGLAGADYPADVRILERSIRALRIAEHLDVLNDTFEALRAGARRPWGLVLICGRGINAAAVSPDGRRARFEGVGEYSGDWGGGTALGWAAIAAAVRGGDGRGGRTALERAVPRYFGLRTPRAMTRALYEGRSGGEGQIAELAPLVFEVAAGDVVARSIVDRLADELIAMATALLRRLRMTRLDPEVVLAGGVFRTGDAAFHERLRAGIASIAPRASLVRLDAPPVLGAALLALDVAGPGTPLDIEARLRTALAAWDRSISAPRMGGPTPR